MTISTTDKCQKTEGYSVVEVPDGLAVNDPTGDAIHFLNPVAGAVFLLCDGKLDATGIARILAEEFALAAPPLSDVLGCLNELAANGLIGKAGMS